ESTHFNNSLVVVFPLEPVRASTGKEKDFRCVRAKSCKHSKLSSTRMYWSLTTTSGLSTIAKLAPFSRAWAAYSFPSKFSPLRAKKRQPSVISRESVETIREVRKSEYSWDISMNRILL